MVYAKKTTVKSSKSVGDIEKLLMKNKSQRFIHDFNPTNGVVKLAFTFEDTAIRMSLKLPVTLPKGLNPTKKDENLYEQSKRTAYRQLLLCIKAKIEAVNCGLETVEQAFLPYIMIGPNEVMGDRVIPQIEKIKKNGDHVLLLS